MIELNINKTNDNYCMRLYKYDTNNNPIYRIGDKIIMKKQIGSDSQNGIIFLNMLLNVFLIIFQIKMKLNY